MGAASTRRGRASWPSGGGFSLLCGRYEGVDHRIREHLVDGELSVGDVVLNGGEVAACLVIEAVTRLLPGAMGNAESPLTESFGATGLLEEPHYTRPASFRGWDVPDVLRSGDHGRIERWRRAQSLHRTIDRPARPDRGARRAHRRGARPVGRVPTRPVSLASPFVTAVPGPDLRETP